MGVAAAHGVDLLNFSLGGAPATAPSQRWLAIGLAAPSSTNMQELTGLGGIVRRTASLASAGSPANLASNLNAITFGPISSARTVIGWSVWSSTAAGAGKPLWYGTLTTSRTLAIGDSLAFAAGALQISIS